MWALIGSLWALPTSLVGLLFALLGWTRFYAFNGGVLVFEEKPGGLCWHLFTGAATFGNVQIYRYGKDSALRVYRQHENRHTWQAWILGPFFLPGYGACSLVSFLRGTGWYAGNALEVDARAAVKPSS